MPGACPSRSCLQKPKVTDSVQVRQMFSLPLSQLLQLHQVALSGEECLGMEMGGEQ